MLFLNLQSTGTRNSHKGLRTSIFGLTSALLRVSVDKITSGEDLLSKISIPIKLWNTVPSLECVLYILSKLNFFILSLP